MHQQYGKQEVQNIFNPKKNSPVDLVAHITLLIDLTLPHSTFLLIFIAQQYLKVTLLNDAYRLTKHKFFS